MADKTLAQAGKGLVAAPRVGVLTVAPQPTGGQGLALGLNRTVSSLLIDVPPMVKARRATLLSVVTATWTLLTMDGSDFDTDTIHSKTTNSDRLTCNTAGKYRFEAGINWDANVTGIRALLIQKNSEALPATANTGVVVAGDTDNSPSTGVNTWLSANGIIQLARNDYLACVVFQNSGGNLNVGTDAFFSMTRLCA